MEYSSIPFPKRPMQPPKDSGVAYNNRDGTGDDSPGIVREDTNGAGNKSPWVSIVDEGIT